jgi:hypothetical protein
MLPVQPQPQPQELTLGTKSWRGALNHLYKAYKGICHYGGVLIPREEASVDHFIPRETRPDLSATWSNLRLAGECVNGVKANHRILDPFEVEPGWIELNVSSGQVQLGKTLPTQLIGLGQQTCHVLNHHMSGLQAIRQGHLEVYLDEHTTDPAALYRLKVVAPYVASEVVRQNIVPKKPKNKQWFV